jgi:hypothetical protein
MFRIKAKNARNSPLSRIAQIPQLSAKGALSAVNQLFLLAFIY